MSPELHDNDDILKDQERILMAGRILPNEGPLTEDQRREALANFINYCRLNEITYEEVGRAVGSPKATAIGELVKGVRRANADNHIRKLNLWVEQDARRRAASLSDRFITTTHVAKTMFNVARLVVEGQAMGMAIGPSGIGKSRCAEALYEKYVGAILLRIHNKSKTAIGLIAALARQLGVQGTPKKGSRHEYLPVFDRILDTLRNSNRLIIIDEAHLLHDDALNVLRDIFDIAGVPILLLATKDLQHRIERDADPDYGQLYSRIDVVYPLTEGRDIFGGEDDKPLFTMDDIRKLYDQPPVRLAKGVTDYLFRVVNQLGRGCLRRGKRLVVAAAIRARNRKNLADNEQVTIGIEDLQWVEHKLRPSAYEQDAVAHRQRVAAKAGAAS